MDGKGNFVPLTELSRLIALLKLIERLEAEGWSSWSVLTQPNLLACPRCGAWLEPRQEPDLDEFDLVSLECPKCHSRFFAN